MSTQQQGKPAKAPGRIKQMVQIYQSTKQYDRNLTLWLLLSLLVPIAIATACGFIFRPNVLGWILWAISGLLVGVLIMMIVLGRRAENTAYSQLEGKAGAVGAVINGALRRSWRGSEVPIAVTRQQDAVYRVVGKGGVVLITEGSQTRTKQLATREMTKLKQAVRGVPITTLHVGLENEGIALNQLSRTLLKLKPVLNRRQINDVHNRLISLKSDPIGIPKGIDPTRMRAPSKPR